MNVIFGNLIRATGEINEAIFPVRHLCARLRDRQRRRRASSAATAAASTASRCSCRRRSTPTSSARSIRCRASPAASPGSPNQLMVRAGGAARARGRRQGRLHPARGRRVLRVPLRRRRRLGRSARRVRPRRCSTTCSTSTSRSRRARRDYGVVLTGRSRTDARGRPGGDEAAARRDARAGLARPTTGRLTSTAWGSAPGVHPVAQGPRGSGLAVVVREEVLQAQLRRMAAKCRRSSERQCVLSAPRT